MAERLLQKGQGRLVHRQRTGDGREEEHEEPDGADQRPGCAHLRKHHRQRVEARGRTSRWRLPRSCRTGRGTRTTAVSVIRPPKPTSNTSFVADAVRRRQHDVVLLAQVRGVVDDHAEADREREEDLPGRGQPGLEAAERARSRRVPHVAEPVAARSGRASSGRACRASTRGSARSGRRPPSRASPSCRTLRCPSTARGRRATGSARRRGTRPPASRRRRVEQRAVARQARHVADRSRADAADWLAKSAPARVTSRLPVRKLQK